MEKSFLENFIKTSQDIIEQSKALSWPIPDGANKDKGELGLLPDDQSIETWQVPLSSAIFLRFLVLLTRSKVILELGTSIGFSTIWLALGAKETGGHVFGTEIFSEKAEIAKKNFKTAKVHDQITLLEEDILDVLRTWDVSKKIDLVFMDADKQRYAQYLNILYSLLSERGLIVVDNVGNYAQHMQDFLAKCKTLNAAIHFLNVDNGLLLIMKNGGANLSELMDIRSV